MSRNSTDCLECRLASGGGLVLSGIYMYYCSQRFQNFSRHVLLGLGPGVGILGFLRIFDLPPFRHETEKIQEHKDDVMDKDNYIIGKLPTKFW